MTYRDNPPTACETCREAEMTWWEKLQRRWSSPTFSEALGSYGILFAMMAGAGPVSWHERHKQAFAETGDAIEFERMLRHVSAEAPAVR